LIASKTIKQEPTLQKEKVAKVAKVAKQDSSSEESLTDLFFK
jgi:hypothetical protein